MLLTLALLVAGTTAEATTQKDALPIVLKNSSGQCSVRFAGKRFSLPDDATRIAHDLRQTNARSVIIKYDPETTYRCISGVIFAAQSAGISNISFDTAEKPNKN